jgi:hypothetical protein
VTAPLKRMGLSMLHYLVVKVVSFLLWVIRPFFR